jgi:hypothetical protein
MLAAMSVFFELLRGFASKIEDDHLDEDQTEVEVPRGEHTQTYHQRTVTLRGKYQGVPVVIMHEKYHFVGNYPQLLDVIDLYTADPEVRYEGVIRPLTGWTRVKRWFGRGGLVGNHPIYADYEFDFEIPPGKGSEPSAFEAALDPHMRARGCHLLYLQSGAGLNGIYAAAGYTQEDRLEALIQTQCGLWPAMSAA